MCRVFAGVLQLRAKIIWLGVDWTCQRRGCTQVGKERREEADGQMTQSSSTTSHTFVAILTPYLQHITTLECSQVSMERVVNPQTEMR